MTTASISRMSFRSKLKPTMTDSAVSLRSFCSIVSTNLFNARCQASNTSQCENSFDESVEMLSVNQSTFDSPNPEATPKNRTTDRQKNKIPFSLVYSLIVRIG